MKKLQIIAEKQGMIRCVFLQQTAEYMDTSHATEGHLVIFDRTPNKSWDEKIYQRTESFDNKTIHVWGM